MVRFRVRVIRIIRVIVIVRAGVSFKPLGLHGRRLGDGCRFGQSFW